MSNFSDVAEIGYGGTVSGEQMLNESVAATVVVGYLMWPGKESYDPIYATKIKTDFSAIPIQVGLKYFIRPAGGFRIYGMAEIGVHMIKAEATVENDFYTPINADAYETRYSIAPGIGIEIPMGNLKLDFGARYQYIAEADAGDLRFLGARLGVIFGGGA